MKEKWEVVENYFSSYVCDVCVLSGWYVFLLFQEFNLFFLSFSNGVIF